MLRHYLERRSYQKALDYLNSGHPENETPQCGHCAYYGLARSDSMGHTVPTIPDATMHQSRVGWRSR